MIKSSGSKDTSGGDDRRRVLYIGYPPTEEGAPHQEMAALWLAKHGYTVWFVAWGNRPAPKWITSESRITYIQVAKKGYGSALRFLWVLARMTREVGPEVIYVQGAQNTPFANTLKWIWKTQTKVYHTQDFVGPGQHWFYERCERRFARHCDWVISNEPSRGRALASIYRLGRMAEVIRTALPSWWVVPARDEKLRESLVNRASLAHSRNPRLIVVGGGYGAGRMTPQLVDAFRLLPDNYGVVFTGLTDRTEENTKCEQHLDTLDLHSRAVLLDRLPFERLLELYAACDIGVLLYPNSCIGHFHQSPGRLTEYLRSGLAIVASHFPGLELLTLKYQLGAVADPYSPEQIARALQTVGDVSNAEMEARRLRLIELSTGELAYESQADSVLGRILSGDRSRQV